MVGGALQRRRARARDHGDAGTLALDDGLHALAAEVHAGKYYECAWQVFRFGQLKGLDDKQAVEAVAAWCHRQGLAMRFEQRTVRGRDSLFSPRAKVASMLWPPEPAFYRQRMVMVRGCPPV